LKIHFLFPLAACVTALLFAPAMQAQSPAQSAPAYSESFRQGATQIMAEQFEVKLSSQDQIFHERLKDSRGSDRYDFSIVPKVPEGDTLITAWMVKIVDLQHRLYENILMTQQQLSDEQAVDLRAALWRLDPSKFALIPSFTKRIIKVDGFYVVLQVKAFRFNPPESPYLDSMTIAVEFTNTDPRTVEAAPK
jgi:hypothetical protein